MESLSCKFGGNQNIWKLSNIFINNPWVKEEIAKENRKYFELNENTVCQNLHSTIESVFLRVIYSIKYLYWKRGKISMIYASMSIN